MTEPIHHPKNENPDYQDRDILLKPILWFIGGLAIVTFLTFVVTALIFRAMDRRMERTDIPASPLATERILPTERLLQVNEVKDLKGHLAEVNELLNNYVLIDPVAGRARIPIERAMEIVAERGYDIPAAAADTGVEEEAE